MRFRFRCPSCRTRRTSFKSLLEHVHRHGHHACVCGGYHYKHRPGSPLCKVNTLSPLRLAALAGASDAELMDIAAQLTWDHAGKQVRKHDRIPF